MVFVALIRIVPAMVYGAGEGFELMLRCLREKKHAAWCAVKVLDFALTDNDTNCQRCGKLLVFLPSLAIYCVIFLFALPHTLPYEYKLRVNELMVPLDLTDRPAARLFLAADDTPIQCIL